MLKRIASLVLAFVVALSAFSVINTVPVNAKSSGSISSFSVRKAKVKNGYKVTVKATFPKNCKSRFISVSFGPAFERGKTYKASKKKSTLVYSTVISKSAYKKGKKNSSGYITVNCCAGCDMGGGRYPTKNKNIKIKIR